MSINLQIRLIICTCTCAFACYAGSVFAGGIGTAGVLEQDPMDVEPCPTFTWSENPAATDYELAVFEDSGDASMNYEDMAELSDPLISTIIQAPASSWTPAGDDCLEEDLSYAWFIRDFSSEGAGAWSVPNAIVPAPPPTRRINVLGELRTTALAADCGGSSVNCRGIFRHDGSGGLVINSHTGAGWADIDVQTNGTTRMYIHDNGEVDIGNNVDIVGNAHMSGRVAIGYPLQPDPTSMLDITNQFIGTPMLKITSGFVPSITRLIVEGDGTVGINTGDPNNLYELDIVGSARATAWLTSSSREYKEDIKKVPTGEYKQMLKRLMSMDLATYRYKQEFGDDGDTKLGFIAEDMPDEVLSSDGKAVDIYALLSYTIGAIQEQQRELVEVAALKAENQALRAQTEGLRQLVCQDHPRAEICN